jgi:hypothetical protein
MTNTVQSNCKLHLTGISYAGHPAKIHGVSVKAGAAVGEATVSWPQKYAENQNARFGTRAYITIGNEVVFRGCILSVNAGANGKDDVTELSLYDDKWLMARNIIGQIGIFSISATAGFQDVGFDIVFNRDGKPDKDPSKLDFNLGSTAVLWTLKNIMQFIFQYYIDADVATLNLTRLSASYDKRISNVNLLGHTALQAVDAIAEMAGESWGLYPKSSASEFVPVRPGGYGPRRTISVPRPKSGGSSGSGLTASGFNAPGSIVNARDNYQVHSGNIIRESVYSSTGTDPLLKRDASYLSPVFTARYKVDVTKYAVNNVGVNLQAGAQPKKWLTRLVTRLNEAGSAYLTAAQIATDPTLEAQPGIPPCIWISSTGQAGDARFVMDGYRLDCRKGTLELRRSISVRKVGIVNETESLSITDWSAAGIWLTVATVLETFDYVKSETSEGYLPKAYTLVARKSDLNPEQRYQTVVPDLTTGVKTSLAATLEKYVDVTTRMNETLAALKKQATSNESSLALEIEDLTPVNIGDLVVLSGRALGQAGNEVVISVTWDVPGITTNIQATNQIAGVAAKVNYAAAPRSLGGARL